MSKITKLQQILTRTGSSLLKTRADLIIQGAEREMKKRYDDLDAKLLELEEQLIILADISPRSADSLDFQTSDGKPFDLKNISNWVDDFIRLEKQKYNLTLERNVAKKLYDKWCTKQIDVDDVVGEPTNK